MTVVDPSIVAFLKNKKQAGTSGVGSASVADSNQRSMKAKDGQETRQSNVIVAGISDQHKVEKSNKDIGNGVSFILSCIVFFTVY